MLKALVIAAVAVVSAGAGVFVSKHGCPFSCFKGSEGPEVVDSGKCDDCFLPTCNPEAMSAAQQERYQEVRKKLHAAIQETRELPDGFGFRLPADAATCLLAAEFVTLERQCCSFFKFTIEQEPGDGPLWLRLTGNAATKKFLKDHLESEVTKCCPSDSEDGDCCIACGSGKAGKRVDGKK